MTGLRNLITIPDIWLTNWKKLCLYTCWCKTNHLSLHQLTVHIMPANLLLLR